MQRLYIIISLLFLLSCGSKKSTFDSTVIKTDSINFRYKDYTSEFNKAIYDTLFIVDTSLQRMPNFITSKSSGSNSVVIEKVHDTIKYIVTIPETRTITKVDTIYLNNEKVVFKENVKHETKYKFIPDWILILCLVLLILIIVYRVILKKAL